MTKLQEHKNQQWVILSKRGRMSPLPNVYSMEAITTLTPQFLPAMERAAAFVTDVGGITSHTAIVARELKKPCIVGTKLATRMLKDNDLVEVDATKGIITILKKSNASQ